MNFNNDKNEFPKKYKNNIDINNDNSIIKRIAIVICQCRRISRYYIFLSSYASFISIIGFIIVVILFLSLLMLLLLLFLVVFTVVKHNTISYENTTSLRFGEPLTGSILDHFWSLWPSS